MNQPRRAPAITSLNDVLALLAADREALDALIRRRLRSDVLLVNQIGEHIINAGGKRLRPLIHLLAARACGYRGEQHIQLAAVIEFIHTATLLHDDVVDGSDRRRGQQTAHRIWGNAASVLVGDFLYSRSFQLMVELNRLRIMEILADTTNTIAAGEVLQLMQLGNIELDEPAYMQVIGAKTACLFAAAARLGAVLADAGAETEERMADFGFALGQAFQIADDWLDYSSSDERLGKNLGDDLAEGKVTLPLIHALRRADETQRRFLVGAIESGGTEQLSRVQRVLEDTGALEATREQAAACASRAIDALAILPPSDERDALELLARFACNRSL
ncbi:MAG: polyprenyl synthetase family protein [Wenzhouxiangellaceae bacterium]